MRRRFWRNYDFLTLPKRIREFYCFDYGVYSQKKCEKGHIRQQNYSSVTRRNSKKTFQYFSPLQILYSQYEIFGNVHTMSKIQCVSYL